MRLRLLALSFIFQFLLFLAFLPVAQASILGGLTGGDNAKASSFAIVNVASLVSDSKAGQAINAQLKAELKALKEENDQKETALVKERSEIEGRTASLSAEEGRILRNDFRAKVDRMKAEAAAKRTALDEKSEKAFLKLRDAILTIVKDLSDKRGYDAVFAQQNVVLMSKEVNITDQVMEVLNASLPSLSLD